MKRQCKGSVEWGCCAVCMAVGPRSSRSDAPVPGSDRGVHMAALAGTAEAGCPRQGGGQNAHEEHGHRHSTSQSAVPCDPVTELSVLSTTCEASGCGGLAR